MGGHVDLSGIPEPIEKIYRQAFASFEQVDDLRVKRALIGFLSAVHSEIAPANRETNGNDGACPIG